MARLTDNTKTLSSENTVVCGSSLRAAPVEQTLARARRLGPRLGITRVTEITRLDRIGIPVFASIRPGAKTGSLCVNAGKGVTIAEACASAWMEAIEYALAEPGASAVEIVSATPHEILDGDRRPDAVYDFCPILRARIPLEEPMPCVPAEELLSGARCLVPAELVFLPGEPVAPARYFSSSSNGLASGNSLLEATVHGLAEALESDICSFHLVRDASALVPNETLPSSALPLLCRIEAAGLELYVRHLSNPFDLPCFHAIVADPEADTPLLVNGGYGCHPHRQIALMRAICEAAQSRLSVIHGGRDDLAAHAARFAQWDSHQRREAMQRLLRQARAAEKVAPYETISDHADRVTDLPSAFAVLTEALARNGLHRVCRVVFTPPDADLHVVKILVPELEECEPERPRLGRRLKAFWREQQP